MLEFLAALLVAGAVVLLISLAAEVHSHFPAKKP